MEWIHSFHFTPCPFGHTFEQQTACNSRWPEIFHWYWESCSCMVQILWKHETSHNILFYSSDEWHHIFFTQPDYVVKKNTRALLTCFRPLGQKFGKFYFRKDAKGHKGMIQNGVEGYEIQQDNIYNNTLLSFLLSDSSKTGLYECHADGERTFTKVSMKCE